MAPTLHYNGAACRTYKPDPNMDTAIVLLLPPSHRQGILYRCHDILSISHQGIAKTLKRAQQKTYWVGKAKEVHLHCTNCTVHGKAIFILPPCVPLVNTPIGEPWKMLAIDIFEVLEIIATCY